jgi:hypothetical protein
MIRVRIFHIPFLAVLGSACVTSGADPRWTTPEALNLAPEGHHGETVYVTGALYLGGEAHVIYQSRALHDEMKRRASSNDPDFEPRDYSKYCLTIVNPGKLGISGKSMTGEQVRLRGRFVKDYLNSTTIDFGACLLPTAIVIDRVM